MQNDSVGQQEELQQPMAEAMQGGAMLNYPFAFTGDGRAYFRIWIVNVLLSILTLGIYSAWAKVRREQYFHRNLHLAGSTFDYHGNPRSILKGRILAFAILILLSVSKELGSALYLLMSVIMVFAWPWLILQSLRFRAANTSYRGIRFAFQADYFKVLKFLLLGGLLITLTLGMWLPRFVRDWRKFMLDHTHYGDTPFVCNLPTGQVYVLFFKLLAILLGGVLLTVQFVPMLGVGVMTLMILLVLPGFFFVQMSNLMWSATQLNDLVFSSRLSVWQYWRVSLLNWLATLFTLGLFIPWARVRTAHIRAAALSVGTAGSLETFVAGRSEWVPSVGEGAADLFDVDIGL